MKIILGDGKVVCTCEDENVESVLKKLNKRAEGKCCEYHKNYMMVVPCDNPREIFTVAPTLSELLAEDENPCIENRKYTEIKKMSAGGD